jgi:hypothetical protein
MSTNDCPGANPVNKDVLAAGAWAEHADGSIIYVEGTEGGDVVYSLFDLTGPNPLEFRDMMPEDGFKKTFTWKPGEPSGNGKNEKWLWHDKTPMPWKDRIIKRGVSDGARPPSAGHILSAAARVAESLKLQGAKVSRDFSHKSDETRKRVGGIMDKLKRAVSELRS